MPLKRQPRPTSDAPLPRCVNDDDLRAAFEAAWPTRADDWKRVVEAERAAHLAATQSGTGTAFHAFEAFTAVVNEFIRQMDAKRAADSQAEILDFAVEAPGITVLIPAWAAVAIMHGWMRARHTDVLPDGTKRPPYPVVEAFGLGSESRSRSVIERHQRRSRAVQIALRVALLLCRAEASGVTLSETAAVAAVAADMKTSEATVRRAWTTHGARAREVAQRHEAVTSDLPRPVTET